MTSKIILEKDQTFSQSIFWKGQRAFYHDQGPAAWDGVVPFYITSNPFIASTYATLVLRFIQDWLRKEPAAKKSTFYIAELGAGSGQFSFYFLKTFSELLAELNLNIKFMYVMTDFTPKNIESWQQHPQLQSFVTTKHLDFALFDLEKDNRLKTLNTNTIINEKTCKNPLIVFANYLFDSVVNDIFYVKNHRLYESLITLETSARNLKKGEPKNWKNIQIHHREKLIGTSYYHDKSLDRILWSYAQTLKEGYFLFPIGALRGIQKLQNLCHQRLFLCSSDKGNIYLAEFEGQAFPELDFHGSFSLMVNYHAIGLFFKLRGSEFCQAPRDGLSTAIFSSAFKLSELPETSLALKNLVQGFSPTDFFNFYELLEKNPKADFKFLVSLLCLSNWDPGLFELISEELLELALKENTEVFDFFYNNLEKIAQNFYYHRGAEDIFFSLGRFLYELNFFKEAAEYFLQSLFYFPKNFYAYYNLALCYYYQKKPTKCLGMLNKAEKIKPNTRDVKALITKAKRMSHGKGPP